jgi:hypothetical protein
MFYVDIKVSSDDDDVVSPSDQIDGDVSFEKKDETGEFNFGRQP